MSNALEDENSRFKLAQLWHLVNRTSQTSRNLHLHNCVVNEILKDDFNFNLKVTVNPDSLRGFKIHLKNCTTLHFLYYNVHDIDTFNTLLERGADFTIKNENGQTALHLAMVKLFDDVSKDKVPFINSVLSAHVKFQNSSNPHDDNGFSHLHAACMVNHVDAVQLFLDNGASIEESVECGAPQYALYNPLYFAACFDSFEVIRILVERGANVNPQTSGGVSPLDLLIKDRQGVPKVENPEKEQIMKLMLEKNAVSTYGVSNFHVACTFEDLTMAEQLLEQGADIEYAVPMESPVFPGDTALHFAANNGIAAVIMLLSHGAKLDAANAVGKTPIDICVHKYSLDDMCSILSCTENLRNIRLSDGETRLLDLIPIMRNVNQFKLFLQNEIKDTSVAIPSDSILWPGYTILHLAVTFSKYLESYDREHGESEYDKTFVDECLNHNLPVNVQNSRGQTPIHLAFRLKKYNVVRLLFNHLNQLDQLVDIVDEDNLSYLHIACHRKNQPMVERLLRISDPNIAYNGRGVLPTGSTPLHLAVHNTAHIIAGMLLRHGASIRATDKNGLTPIHWLLKLGSHRHQHVSTLLFAELLVNLEDRVIDELNLSYLHIACLFREVQVVEKLLDFGSDVNAVIKSQRGKLKGDMEFLRRYSLFSPLQMTVREQTDNVAVFDALFRRGADIFAVKKNVYSEISNVYSNYIPIKDDNAVRRFFHVLWDRAMEERLGLTKLHIACYMRNEEAIRSALINETDVNAQINSDSEIFAGCTPLHLLMTILLSLNNGPFTIGGMINLLVGHGADVAIANAEGDTPIQVFCKREHSYVDREQCKELLLNAQRDFSVNPVNSEKVSHFHLACFWHQLEVIEKFVQHGSFDVNQPIDYFANFNAGATPMHLALSHEMREPNNDWTKLTQIVDVLLKHGADVSVKDVRDDTPLHKSAALHSRGSSILEKLVSHGGDLKSENIRGQSPFEELASIQAKFSHPIYNLTAFQQYDYKINSWNRLTGEGYIAKVFPSLFFQFGLSLSQMPEFSKFVESPDVKTVDSFGRTAIHNAVALSKEQYNGRLNDNYVYAIESFMRIGIDIDCQDKSGQTALHYAARMENVIGMKALLACGADINVVDDTGKSAFSYAVKHSQHKRELRMIHQPNVTVVLRMHIKKLQHLGVEVSQLNEDLLKGVQRFFVKSIYLTFGDEFYNLPQNFFNQIEVAKTLNVGIKSLTVYNFLSDTGVVRLYPLLQEYERNIVDDFFKSFKFYELKEVAGIIKLQFRKMRTRLELIDAALTSLRTLLGFSVPGLCEQISRFLSNSDVRNLIQSTIPKTRNRKISETLD